MVYVITIEEVTVIENQVLHCVKYLAGSIRSSRSSNSKSGGMREKIMGVKAIEDQVLHDEKYLTVVGM